MSIAEQSRQRLSALDKSMAVLDAVAAQPQAVGLPDLTVRLGLPKQTVHRVLQQLEAMEFVVREPGRDRYAVGPAFTRLSLAALNSENQSAPVRLVLSGLVADLNETCNLGILRGHEFQYMERIECDWSLRISLPVGARVPAHCTAGGKLMMAFLPDELRHSVLLLSDLKRFTERTLTKQNELEAEFAKIREQGYAVNNEEFTVGTLGLAVPIKQNAGQPLAALALHAPTARLSRRDLLKLVDRLQSAAEQIEACWGLS